MKKTFTLHLRKALLALFLSVLCFGAMAQDLKPYPVYFPLSDYPEFNYGTVTSVTRPNMTNMFWHHINGWLNTSNCVSVAYKTLPSNSVIAAPYGHAIALNIGVNRAMYVDMMTPHLNPGTYRVYLGTSFSSGTARTFNMMRVKMDSVLITPPADTTLRWFNSNGLNTPPNKQSLRFTGTGNNRHYDIYCGKVTITEAGRHKFHFDPSNGVDGTGTEYAFSLLQFIPVTETDANTDYDYPKFDMGGNVYASAADSVLTVNNTATPTGYYLPYQVSDPTAYTTFPVTLDAGLYFANKRVVVKRANDKWTRVYTGLADADGKCTTNLPAGSYYVEVNNALQKIIIDVTGAATIFVGVQTGTINTSYSPEAWYVGKRFQVYNYTATVLLNEFVIPANGILPAFALPVDVVNSYVYYVLNADGTRFDEGTISVPNNGVVTMDKTQVKYAVSINLGNDTYGTNQPFTIVRSTNANALYVSATTNASGVYSANLPDGTYFLKTATGLIFKTFTVSGAALNLNIAERYTANFCLGKTVAGAKIDVRLSSTKALLYSLTVGADGKVACPGITNGRFYHNVYKVSGTDTTWITKKFTFVIDGANFDLGDCGNLEQPYYLPYKVYYDIANQPEITWMSPKSFQPGELSRIKCDVVPIDTIYNVRDTTWTYLPTDTTFRVNYDSTSIRSITNFDWALYYGFGGITIPSTAANAYIWGDQFNFRLPAKRKLTFVTPNLNPGRYNVYMTNRWKPAPQCPIIDTTYMDGKPLAVTDGIVRSFVDYGNSAVLRQMQMWTGQGAMHMGEALITKTGTHELALYSKLGSGNTSGQSSTVWANMIFFIPIDEDSARINISNYYPRMDYTGQFVWQNATQGSTVNHTTLGTDGVNKPKYFVQFKDPSVFSSDVVDYSKKLTINGGIYSRGDKLITLSPLDNWTTKEALADTITGIASVPVKPYDLPYKWDMLTEGVTGEAVLNSNKLVTIPEVINTAITSSYTYTPNVDDPALATYFINSKITITDNLPFYYPITGVVLYDLDGSLLKASGDTIYRSKTQADNGIAPTYSSEIAIMPNYVFIATYTGNGKRLMSAMNTSSYTSVKNVKMSAGIYPNPARETLVLKVNENSGIAIYALYNQLGQVVRKGSFAGTEASISLNGVEKGIYFVKVDVNGEQINTKLIVE